MIKNERIEKLLINILKGIGFGFLVYMLSGDGGVSVGLGLLFIYLEYKLK